MPTGAESCSASSLLTAALVLKVENREKLVQILNFTSFFIGKELLRRLVNEGVRCTYALVHGLAYVMKEVTKVFLGAHTLFSNGTVLSRAGTASVAMTAHSFNVPVIVCCETYKFTERVQLDSFVFNELGDPDELVDTSVVSGEYVAQKYIK